MTRPERYPPVPEQRGGASALLLAMTRVWLPALIALGGVVAIVLGRGHTVLASAGVGLLLVAITVWMVNWMFRMSVQSNRDREQEERNREYFDLHGRWPGERP